LGKNTNKCDQVHKDWIVRALAEAVFEPTELKTIAAKFKEQFGFSIAIENVAYYKREHRQAILEEVLKINSDILNNTPIAQKGWRIQEIQKLYRKNSKAYIRANLLRAAAAETNTLGDRLVEALGKTGNTYITTLEINNFADKSDEQLKSRARDTIGVLSRICSDN
jgi:hypothetical protein